MEIACMVTPMVMENRASAAVEIAVDAYATRVLTRASPAEACVDESLGPYVTSLLRCSLQDMEDVSSIPEFESLLELLEEHCSLSKESATTALTTIATAVRTGVVPSEQRMNSFDGSFRNSNLTAENSYYVDPDTLFSVAAETADNSLHEFPPLSEAQDRDESCEKGRTPLKEDRLIPVDLLGALDDPSTPPLGKSNQAASATKSNEEFPPLGPTPQASKKHGGTSSTKGKKSSKKKAEDLVAVLFRSSRPRQSSIDSDNVSRSTTSAGSGGPSIEAQQLYNSQNNQYFQQQWDMAVEMLLTVNPELGEEAAAEAALMANADANLAQYLINQALQAPPVCRHMLSGACYRSDCQFSHDVEGHTCLFWIRGRCGKGPSCRFLHGFSEKAQEEIHELSGSTTALSPGASSAPMAISTANLVSHNMNAAFSAPQYDSNPFSSFQPGFHRSNSSGFDAGSFSMPSSWAAPSSLEPGMQSLHLDDQERAPAKEGSFASIASKGYSSAASFTLGDPASQLHGSNFPTQKERTVKIPQHLWNPHINRDAHMFHIQDPIERYKAVSASSSTGRNDVLDLHFQSTKTFPIVLANVLPKKLEENEEVWVVTGTGHHVSKSTHQQGGGALESALLSWLSKEGYDYVRGRDRNGHGGAVLVKRF